MTERQKYQMSQEQLDKLFEAIKPVPLMMLQCGMPSSPQERANDAWKALGKEIGFDGMTVRPNGSDPRNFTAVPKD